MFAEHGKAAVVTAKFFPWLGFLLPPLAGAFGFSVRKFLWLDALGSLLYGALYLGLGFLFGREIVQLVNHFGLGGLVLLSLVAASLAGYKFVKQRKAMPLPAAPSPGDLVSVPKT